MQVGKYTGFVCEITMLNKKELHCNSVRYETQTGATWGKIPCVKKNNKLSVLMFLKRRKLHSERVLFIFLVDMESKSLTSRVPETSVVPPVYVGQSTGRDKEDVS